MLIIVHRHTIIVLNIIYKLFYLMKPADILLQSSQISCWWALSLYLHLIGKPGVSLTLSHYLISLSLSLSLPPSMFSHSPLPVLRRKTYIFESYVQVSISTLVEYRNSFCCFFTKLYRYLIASKSYNILPADAYILDSLEDRMDIPTHGYIRFSTVHCR